jgi:hypothetical protein
MKRCLTAALARVPAVLAAVVTGLMLCAGPAAADNGRGDIEHGDLNVPLTNIGVL